MAHRAWLPAAPGGGLRRGRRRRGRAPGCCTPTAASSRPAPTATWSAPEWFDHRYRFRPERPRARPRWARDAIAVTGACMYLRRDLIDAIGAASTTATPMGYEDVDYCLRAWEAGRVGPLRVRSRRSPTSSRPPAAPTSGRARAGAPRAASGSRWGELVRRPPRAHRRRRAAGDLRDRGHRRRRRPPRHLRAPQPPAASGATRWRCTRWAASPSGSRSRRRCTRSRTYRRAGRRAGARRTRSRSPPGGGPPSRCGARRCGAAGPVFFVQDIETSYYAGRRRPPGASCATRCWPATAQEFRYMTISDVSSQERLQELGAEAELVPPGHRPGHLPPARRRAPRRHGAGARAGPTR